MAQPVDAVRLMIDNGVARRTRDQSVLAPRIQPSSNPIVPIINDEINGVKGT